MIKGTLYQRLGRWGGVFIGSLLCSLISCDPVSLDNIKYPDNFGDDTTLSTSLSGISIGSTLLGAGSTTNIIVTARDTLGNLFTNSSLIVGCSLVGGTSVGTFSSTTDNLDGTYSITMTATVSGTTTGLICTMDSKSVSSASPSVTVTFSPIEISNLALWLDASSLSLSNGASLSSWTDLSGNNNHAVQGTPGDQPTFNLNVVNSLPAVNFDGTSDHLAFTSINMQPATIFVVGRYGIAVTAPYLGDDATTGFAGYSGTGSVFYLSTSASLTVVSATPLTFSLYTVDVQASGTNSEIFEDAISAVTGDRNWGADVLQFVGRRNGERFDGDIAEIVVFSSVITGAQISQVTNYLQTKYGI